MDGFCVFVKRKLILKFARTFLYLTTILIDFYIKKMKHGRAVQKLNVGTYKIYIKIQEIQYCITALKKQYVKGM